MSVRVPWPVRVGLRGIVLAAVATAVASLWLPWCHLEVKGPGALSLPEALASAPLSVRRLIDPATTKISVRIRQGDRTISTQLGDLTALPRRIRGIELPQLAQRDDVQAALMLWGMATATDRAGEVPARAQLVYLVPLIALGCGLLSLAARRWPRLHWAVAAIASVVAADAWWRLSRLARDLPYLTITIGEGVWAAWWAFVAIALAGVALAVLDAPQRRA